MNTSFIMPKNFFPKYHKWVFLIKIGKRKQAFLHNLFNISERKNIQKRVFIVNENTHSPV